MKMDSHRALENFKLHSNNKFQPTIHSISNQNILYIMRNCGFWIFAGTHALTHEFVRSNIDFVPLLPTKGHHKFLTVLFEMFASYKYGEKRDQKI